MDFKDYFTLELARDLGGRFHRLDPGFDRKGFLAALPGDIEPLEMKARVACLSGALWTALDRPFAQAAPLLCQALDAIPGSRHDRLSGFPVWVIADIVEKHGLADFDAAMTAIHKITRHFTGEFAIRPFLAREPEATLARMQIWVDDPSEDVRRLVSEGTRPRLPWATRVPWLLEDPAPVMALLTRLRHDDSRYVQRSVANNLNDISKDHPDRVVRELATWSAQAGGGALAWLTRHALRTLARRGHADALSLLGYAPPKEIEVPTFTVGPRAIRLGESISIDCAIRIPDRHPSALMIDYAILAPGARGQINHRIFKWSKRRQPVSGAISLQREHRIGVGSAKQYYPGEHQVELIINGKVQARSQFRVTG